METANIEVLKWLRDIANVRAHQTIQEQPVVHWQHERQVLQHYQPKANNIIQLPPARETLYPSGKPIFSKQAAAVV